MDVFLSASGGGHVIGMTFPLHPVIERQWRDGILTRVNEDGSPYDGDEHAIVSGGGDTANSWTFYLDDMDKATAKLEAGKVIVPPPAAAQIAAAVAVPEVVEPVRPVGNAPKAAWVAFAVALGVAPEAEAKAMTKSDLVAACTPPEMLPADPGE